MTRTMFTRRAALQAVALAAVVSAARADDGFTKIGPAELDQMLAKKDFFFVNVHIPYEGEIAGTDAKIAYDTIMEHLGELPADRNARIVLYCRSGRMSDIAARELVKAGYTQVFDLAGGMNAWTAAGHAIEMK